MLGSLVRKANGTASWADGSHPAFDKQVGIVLNAGIVGNVGNAGIVGIGLKLVRMGQHRLLLRAIMRLCSRRTALLRHDRKDQLHR